MSRGRRTPKKAWEMSETVEDYLSNVYKDNILSQIKLPSGKSLLDTTNFNPYSEDSRLTTAKRNEIEERTRGYTYPSNDKVFINNLETTGFPANQSDFNFYYDKLDKEKLNKLSDSKRTSFNNSIWKQVTEQKLAEDKDLGRTGLHESIHNLTNRHYKNAITEMLRGTSELGQGGDRTDYFHPTERITTKYIDPDTGEFETRPARYSEVGGKKGTRFEQDELLTQALTNALTSQKPSKYAGGNASGINSLPYMLYQNMDRPGQGPLGQKGMEEFLMKRIQPFMNQLKSDSEAGYIQNSIWK